jgi:hypothetical protein
LIYVGENVVILLICVSMTQTRTFGPVICLGDSSSLAAVSSDIVSVNTCVLRGFALTKMEPVAQSFHAFAIVLLFGTGLLGVFLLNLLHF